MNQLFTYIVINAIFILTRALKDYSLPVNFEVKTKQFME